ncbi:MAG: 7,8-didemethyl-8-hydroxy-5-deazariboflavin synthase CofG [Candidatus Helarchaeota archaeon]
MNWKEKIFNQISFPTNEIFQKVLDGKNITPNDAYTLYETSSQNLPLLMLIANFLRRKFYSNVISFSKNIFIDVTHLCRNKCAYCGFRQEPEKTSHLILSIEEILKITRKGKQLGCKEALITLGEKPELKYKRYKDLLKTIGNYSTTIEYLRDICELIFNETGLLPHCNPGVLEKKELKELKEVNASLGLMLETSSRRLLEKGAPHEYSPGKDPQLRINTIKYAGELNVPFTTGILVGIGETYKERIDSIFKIKELHKKYGHIQEIIIQNFLPKKNTPMQTWPSPSLIEMLKIVCITRIIFQGKMNIQIPPNLNENNLEVFLLSGINDWGGISPLTKDFINPEKEWPSLQKLLAITRRSGFQLKERLPIYPEFARKDKFISKLLKTKIKSLIDENGFVKK